MDNLFELATRGKYRFEYKGLWTVEDLWDMTLSDLDLVFKKLNAAVKLQKEESLLTTRSAEDTVTDRKIEIVKYIVAVKLQEQADRVALAEKKAKKQKLLEALEQKQTSALGEMSVEDIQKAIAELG